MKSKISDAAVAELATVGAATAKPKRKAVVAWSRVAAVTLAVLIALAGCTAPTVLKGSTVTVAVSAGLSSLNDRTSYGNSLANSSILQATNSSFNRYDDQSLLVTDPSFGSYQLLSNDPLTVKYTIADGVKWSDGVPVDAADLVLAWVANSGTLNTKNVSDSSYRDAETGRYAKQFPPDVVHFDGTTSEGLQYVTKPPEVSNDQRSVTLTWDSYVVDWPLLVQVGLPAHVVAARALGIPLSSDSNDDVSVNPERIKQAQVAKSKLIEAVLGNDTGLLSQIANVWNSDFDLDAMPEDESILVSTGPYLISNFNSGESVTLRANPRYSGAHNPVYESVTVRFLAEASEQVSELADGAVDVSVPRTSSDTVTALAEIPGATIRLVPSRAFVHLDLMFANGKNATFADERLREAFLKTVPTAALRSKVLGDALADASERSSLVFLPGAPGYLQSVAENGSAQFASPDIAGAKEILAKAGAVSPTVCMMFDPANPKRVQEFQLIADSAALAGFVVTNCSGPDWRNLLGSPGVYDAAIFAWSSSNLSVSGLQSIFGADGRGNLNGFQNLKVQDLLARLAVTPDEAKQEELRLQLDAALYADAYGLPLYQEQRIVAFNATVAGVKPAPLAPGILWNIWEWEPVVPDE